MKIPKTIRESLEIYRKRLAEHNGEYEIGYYPDDNHTFWMEADEEIVKIALIDSGKFVLMKDCPPNWGKCNLRHVQSKTKMNHQTELGNAPEGLTISTLHPPYPHIPNWDQIGYINTLEDLLIIAKKNKIPMGTYHINPGHRYEVTVIYKPS